jgi:hypothetical protein
MNLQLKAKIEAAIEKVINDTCEADYPPWDHYIHGELYRQMTDAAELVFDVAQAAQKFMQEQDE